MLFSVYLLYFNWNISLKVSFHLNCVSIDFPVPGVKMNTPFTVRGLTRASQVCFLTCLIQGGLGTCNTRSPLSFSWYVSDCFHGNALHAWARSPPTFSGELYPTGSPQEVHLSACLNSFGPGCLSSVACWETDMYFREHQVDFIFTGFVDCSFISPPHSGSENFWGTWTSLKIWTLYTLSQGKKCWQVLSKQNFAFGLRSGRGDRPQGVKTAGLV